MFEIQKISNKLRLGEDDVWYSDRPNPVSYPSDGTENCMQVEDSSFWFKHRNNCIITAIRSFPPKNNAAIFDIGGGNGYVSSGLIKAGFNTILLEPNATGASNAKMRGVKNVICASVESAKIKSKSLSAIGLFDVIEHIEDDLEFLKLIEGMLKSNGRVYVTVPAYSFLWSAEDITAGHYRRYSKKTIRDVLIRSGFEIEFYSYIFRPLPIPIFLLRCLPYRIGLSKKTKSSKIISRDHRVKRGILAKIISLAFLSESKNLNRKKSMSFGGSCLIVAKKINK